MFAQAGNSEVGRDFAAKYAEMIYAAAQFIEKAHAFYDDVKARVAKFGRDPDYLKVMPGLSFAIGRTRQEAQDKFDALEAAVDFRGELNLMGQDMAGYDLDGPLPDLPEPANGKGRWKQLTALARRENLTVRQLFLRFNAFRAPRIRTGSSHQPPRSSHPSPDERTTMTETLDTLCTHAAPFQPGSASLSRMAGWKMPFAHRGRSSARSWNRTTSRHANPISATPCEIQCATAATSRQSAPRRSAATRA